VSESPTELTAEEGVKLASNLLRGDLLEDLASPAPHLEHRNEHLLKFHGIYAQDNRDVRRERSLAGETLDYIFMIRVAIPGGRLSPDQWLSLDTIAEDLADGTIRLTTRQAVQFHGVVKHGLQPLCAELHAHAMTSFAGCGDVVRNTVMCPALVSDPAHAHVTSLAQHIAETFRPQTQAHFEIFVNGEKVATITGETEHEFYGDTYLPRSSKSPSPTPTRTALTSSPRTWVLFPPHTPSLVRATTSSSPVVLAALTPSPKPSPAWLIP